MIDFIYHVTLNTGHFRKSYPNEVDKELFFVLHRFFRDSLKAEGTEILDGCTLKSTQADGQTVGTLFGPSGLPILTVGCSKTADRELWNMLHETSIAPLATNPNIPPATAYIADRIEVGSVLHLDVMKWTGDFSRCFGWMAIAPEKLFR